MSLEKQGGFRSRSTRQHSEQPRAHDQEGQRRHERSKKEAPQRQSRGDAGVDKARIVAFDVLQTVQRDDAYANLVLPKALRERKITGRDAAFATELTYGSLRTLGVLDAVIDASSSRPARDIQPDVLTALRLGAYQVLYTRVEPHAAVDTTVRLVERARQERAKGFANAVMRTITRRKPEQWLAELAPKEGLAALAFRTAHPVWIAESFATALAVTDPEDPELVAALTEDSERPQVHLVARPGEISAEELALISGGEEGKYSPYAVYLEGGDPSSLEPVRQGLAAVQDEGSQIIARAVTQAELVGEDSGRWLDLCAGPGGKAALIGALARIDAATVDAVEVAPHRARLIENAVRDLPVKVHVADGRDPGLEPGFDRILVDAPCSGLGALRRRPEARWRKQESDIAELTTLQFELLTSAAKLVRPGGVIVYSTCSPDVRETRGIVDRAVSELGLLELDAHGLACDMPDLGAHKSVQMWPHRHGTDAMFFAVLQAPTALG